MSQPIAKPRVFRFGLYELDAEARELRKSGVRIKLQEQPFQILSMLLERPGSVVTREELQKKLWPADVFVDFDLSLNSAVKKLRQALNDDSENPRFIETLYRRGYRFIGPVNGSVNGKTEQVDIEPPPGPVLLSAAQAQHPAADSNSNRSLIVYSSVALLILVVTIALLWRRFVPLPPPRVLGFTQITHDGLFKGQIFSDGERLYIMELQGDRFVVNQVSVAGGDTSTVPTPFANIKIDGVAPNGSALVVTSFEGTGGAADTWFLPLPSGPPRRLGDLHADSIAWSPDGSQVIFSDGTDIYIAKNDLSDRRKLATAGVAAATGAGDSKIHGVLSGLRFSPDGRRIRFEVTDPGNSSSSIWEISRDMDPGNSSSSIWEVGRGGKGVRPVLPGWDNIPQECCGNWTPDGRYFVFQSFQEGRNSIWALPEKSFWRSRTPKPVQLTNGPLDFGLPVVSKDGKRIFAIGSQPRCELARYDGKSGFRPYLDGGSIGDLAFSPDGEWMAYVTVPEGQLWRSRVDGSSRLQLTPEGMYGGLPRWSPDGKQIVFMGTRFKTDWLAYLIASDGTGLRELIPGAKSGYDPTWSADGKSIAMTLSAGGSPLAHTQYIAVYDLETGNISELPESKGLFSPRWSPDGRYIAALTNDSLKLMLFDRVTQAWRDMVVSTPIGYPSWSHDGKYIYFDTSLNEDPAFYRVRISDRKLERLVSLKGLRRYWGQFGPWTGLTPDDTPLVVRDTSSQEVYALDWEAP